MKKARVSVVKLKDYDSQNVYQAVKISLDRLGGLENIIKPGSKVFVKINHLSPPSPPERAIVTHPAFARGVLQLLKELRTEITVGDDIQSKQVDGFMISGYRQLCNELGIRLVNLKEAGFKEVNCQGQILKKVFISPLVLESDFILNLPKLKTHALTIFTGAIKNMFGIIPYGLRLHYHRQYPNNEIFSQMLVDIFCCAPPHLTIMDSIVAMEGEGPSAGPPRKIGIILASRDAVALDAVATKLTGYDPMDIYMIQSAHQRGLGTGEIRDIEVVGEKISEVEVKDFKHSAIATGFLQRKIPAFLYALLQNQLVFIPEVRRSKCSGCLECINICPGGAAKLDQGTAWIDKSLCLHCMCCHEVCRFWAIKLKQKPAGRMFRGMRFLYKSAKSLFS